MIPFDGVIMIGILGHRLANIHVGVTNVVPRDQQRMSPSQFNLKECDFYPGQVPDDATVRINCPPRITGRYLVVQLQDSNFLTLCEVTAAAGWCQGPFIKWKLTLIPAGISNHMPSKVRDGITYPSPNFNGAAVEVWELISNFIPHFMMDVITYPCWD